MRASWDVLHRLDGLRMEAFEELARRVETELGIRRLDRDEEAIVRGALEALGVEDGMMQARQLVEREHSEERRERRGDDAELERDRDECGPREERLARDDEAVGAARDPCLQEEAARGARHRACEHDQRERRRLQAHRLLEPVDRERRVRVPLREARVANGLAGMVELARRRELREQPVGLGLRRRAREEPGERVLGQRDHEWLPAEADSAGWRCGSAAGVTPFSSASATIGTKRTNRQ